MSFLSGAAVPSIEIRLAKTVEEVNDVVGGQLNIRGYIEYLIKKYQIVGDMYINSLVENVLLARTYILSRKNVNVHLENYRELKKNLNIHELIKLIEKGNGLAA